MLFGVVTEARELFAAQIVDLDEAGLDTVNKRSEVYNAGGHDTETLDDLGADNYGPGRMDGVGCMGGTIEVCDLGDDGCDDPKNAFSDSGWNNARWTYIRRARKKTSRMTFLLAATLSRRTIIEGRMTNVISVRPLKMAMKYAQDVCFKGFFLAR